MIDYEEDWLLPLVFRTKGSVMGRAAIFSLPAAVLAFLLLLAEDYFPDYRQDLGFVMLGKSHLWSALVAVLSILLGFRTNRAMSRFWEGTGLLHQMRGEWFDSVSCCVTFSRGAVAEKGQDVKTFRHTLVRLMSLCHGSALEEIANNSGDIQCIDAYGLDNKTLQHLKDCKEIYMFNRVEVLLHMTQTVITKGLEDGVLKIPPPILSRVYQTLSRGFVNLLNAKKIADTRFPFPYAQLITMLLLMHTVATPLMISATVPSKVWAPIITFVPLFSMFYLNFVGVELENPFGDDDNDLPLDHFQSEMNNCLLMLLQEGADLVPSISNKRCQKNFDILQQSIRQSLSEEGEGDYNRRISCFNFAYNIDEGDERDRRGEASPSSGGLSPLASDFQLTPSAGPTTYEAYRANGSLFGFATDGKVNQVMSSKPISARSGSARSGSEPPRSREVSVSTSIPAEGSTPMQGTKKLSSHVVVSPRPPSTENGCFEPSSKVTEKNLDFVPAIDAFLQQKNSPASPAKGRSESVLTFQQRKPPLSAQVQQKQCGQDQTPLSHNWLPDRSSGDTDVRPGSADVCLDDFRSAVSQWTAMIEGQLSELRHNTVALKNFNEAIPQLISGKPNCSSPTAAVIPEVSPTAAVIPEVSMASTPQFR